MIDDGNQGIEKYSSVWEHKLRCKNFLQILRLSGLLQNLKQMGSQGQLLAGVPEGAKPPEAPSFMSYLKDLMPITFSSPRAQPEVLYFLISNESPYFSSFKSKISASNSL